MKKSALPRRKRLFFAASIVAVAAVIVPTGLTAASASVRTSHVKPTIVLVHGAWADGSSFAPETAALQRAGYKVLVAPNPLRGLANDTTVLSNYLAQKTSGPVVLVAHSYGGMVTTGAALSDPDVKALVYVDAYAPAAGDSAQSLSNVLPGSLLNVPDPQTVFDFVVPYPNAPQAEYDSYIKLDKFKSIFAASLPTSVTDVLAAGQSPATLGAIGTPFSGEPAWKSIPSWYFIGTADKVIPPAEQEVMAKRAGSHIVKANAPHLSMLANPLQVTSLILSAAQSVH